jgi:hypothetical protein
MNTFERTVLFVALGLILLWPLLTELGRKELAVFYVSFGFFVLGVGATVSLRKP